MTTYELNDKALDVAGAIEDFLISIINENYTDLDKDMLNKAVDMLVDFSKTENHNKIEESVTNVANVAVKESFTDAQLEESPSLLIAIDSEKDAEVTYKTLIEDEKNSDTPNQENIDLLEHILSDELEHIALLSALVAKQNEDYVGGDSKSMFNKYIDEIPTED